jgi:hypothetical protein
LLKILWKFEFLKKSIQQMFCILKILVFSFLRWPKMQFYANSQLLSLNTDGLRQFLTMFDQNSRIFLRKLENINEILVSAIFVFLTPYSFYLIVLSMQDINSLALMAQDVSLAKNYFPR